MKFKTPSKPVVKLAYYADSKLSENSQNTVDHVFTVPDSGRFFTGDFLKKGKRILEPGALHTGCHRLFATFGFEDIQKTQAAIPCICYWITNKQIVP